ncbi:MAG: V-type ATP synthase subunit E [Candidatus Fermentibacteraceae bacterium]
MTGMSLEAIRQKIMEDAETEAERLLSQARHEKKAALEDTRARLTVRAEKDRARLQENLRERKARMRENALRSEERSLLNTRRTLMDDALNRAVDGLVAGREYTDLIASFLKRCDLTGEVEVIISGNDSERITQSFLDSHSSSDLRFRLSKERHASRGGVILRSGKVSQNATLDMVASLIHEELVMELSPLLPLEKLENL